MKDLVIKGQITTTSNKQSDKFVAKTPQKTAYLKLDEENTKKAEAFGLTKYTSKENNEDFFMVKVVTNLRAYYDNSRNYDKLETGVDSPNFKTKDGKEISLAIVQGENLGNVFYRLSAIKISQSSDIETIEAENPFV